MKQSLLLAFLLLTGCSNLPPAIEDPPAYDLGYLEAAVNTDKFKNAPVRWGGTIVEVENEPNFTAIQVLSYPLSSRGRPDLDENQQGRFVVKTPDFLDPAVYKKNTSITVAGALEGNTERKIGNKPLQLPLVSAKTYPPLARAILFALLWLRWIWLWRFWLSLRRILWLLSLLLGWVLSAILSLLAIIISELGLTLFFGRMA